MRLHAVLRRRGINPTWRTSSDKSGQILLMPCLDTARRYMSEEIPDEMRGIPAVGRWESLCCAWSCGDRIVDVASYREEDPGALDSQRIRPPGPTRAGAGNM